MHIYGVPCIGITACPWDCTEIPAIMKRQAWLFNGPSQGDVPVMIPLYYSFFISPGLSRPLAAQRHPDTTVGLAPPAWRRVKCCRANCGKGWSDGAWEAWACSTALRAKTSSSKSHHVFLARLVMLITFNKNIFVDVKEKCFDFVFVLKFILCLS